MSEWQETPIGFIPSEWDYLPFDSILTGSTRNGIYKPKKFHGRGVKVVNMGELFANNRIGNIPMSRIELAKKELDLACLKNGDLIFARRSLTAEGAGKCSIILQQKEPLTFESSIIRARPDNTKADSRYLYYLFNSRIGKYLLKSILRQVAVAGITGEDLKCLNLPLPKLTEQNSAANLLESLDLKIDNLQRQNQTLEKIAQTLFKQWFVDFNFPGENGKFYKDNGGEMVGSELGEIPKGWEVSKVTTFGTIVCGKTPPKKKSKYYSKDIPFVKIPDMHNNIFVVESIDHLSHEGSKSQQKKLLPVNSILVSCIATVGLVAINSKPSHTNQQINAIVLNELSDREYLFLTLKRLQPFLLALGSGGSATLNINTSTFGNIEILSPKKQKLNEFHYRAKNLFEKILSNLNQIQTLTKTRDTLLPKLMSGQIRVSD